MNCLKYTKVPKLLSKNEKASLNAMSYFELMNKRSQINQINNENDKLKTIWERGKSNYEKGYSN